MNKDLNDNKPLTFYIGDVNKLFHNRIKELSERSGLNATYIKILMIIHLEGKVSQADIASFTHFKAPTISLTLQKMESEGLIERVQDENDQRIVNVTLTEKGNEMDKKLRKIFSEEDRKISNLFNEEELENFNKYLLRIIDFLEEE